MKRLVVPEKRRDTTNVNEDPAQFDEPPEGGGEPYWELPFPVVSFRFYTGLAIVMAAFGLFLLTQSWGLGALTLCVAYGAFIKAKTIWRFKDPKTRRVRLEGQTLRFPEAWESHDVELPVKQVRVIPNLSGVSIDESELYPPIHPRLLCRVATALEETEPEEVPAALEPLFEKRPQTF